MDASTTAHINDQIGPDVEGSPLAEATAGVWPFVNGPHQWTPGTHKFFGWLAMDANMTSNNTPEGFFGSGFGFNRTVTNGTPSDVLTIPSKQMTATTPQFDFMYSNVYSTEPVNTPVPLEFGHLFTAFSIGAWNTSDSKVTITAFELQNLKNTNSAIIDFSGSDNIPSVSYGTSSASAVTYRSLEVYGYELTENQRCPNIFKGPGQAQEFTLMWPQDATDVHSSEKAVENANGTIEYPSSWMMYIKYTVTTDDGSSEHTKRLNFPDMSWEAGKKYHFDIVFADKMVELIASVNPWNYESQDVDFKDSAVTLKENHHLTWDGTTGDINSTNKQIFIINGQPIKGSFTLDTPQGGTWIVSLEGDVDAFEISPDNGEIDGVTSTISVKPLVGDPKRDYMVSLKFAVRRPDGRIISADDIIQPTGTKYTIVLPSN